MKASFLKFLIICLINDTGLIKLDKSLVHVPFQVYKMIVMGGGGERLGRPILSPGKKLTSQFLPPPHFTHPIHVYDIFKIKNSKGKYP